MPYLTLGLPMDAPSHYAVEDGPAEPGDAVAEWYRAYLTGVILSVVARRSAVDAAELVFRIFRRQHLERFLPGLRKLGLADLPPAVAAAQYHYLSNAIGGVRVEYMYESDRKAWIRYPPPRWIWHGTAICAIPGQVSRAVLRGWHAHCGVSLGEPRLGFVCTKQTADGDAGLEGYFYEHDHELAPDERLRFARHEEAPVFDPAAAPVLATAEWPTGRLRTAHRNYAMDYVRALLPEAVQLFGPELAGYLLGLSGRLIGMQFYFQTAAALGVGYDPRPLGFARFMIALAAAQRDRARIVDHESTCIVACTDWTLMRGVPDLHAAAFGAWNSLLEGALMAHNRHLALQVTARRDLGDPTFEWHIVERRGVVHAATEQT